MFLFLSMSTERGQKGDISVSPPFVAPVWIKQSSSCRRFEGEREAWPVLQLVLPTAWLFLPNSDVFHLTLLLLLFLLLLSVSPPICLKLYSPKVMQCDRIICFPNLCFSLSRKWVILFFIGWFDLPLFKPCLVTQKTGEKGKKTNFLLFCFVCYGGEIDLTKL